MFCNIAFMLMVVLLYIELSCPNQCTHAAVEEFKTTFAFDTNLHGLDPANQTCFCQVSVPLLCEKKPRRA